VVNGLQEQQQVLSSNIPLSVNALNALYSFRFDLVRLSFRLMGANLRKKRNDEQVR